MQPHIPIMVAESLEGLRVAEIPNACWIDATVGAGGHSHAILSERTDSQLLGLDLDPGALEIASGRLAEFGDRVMLHYASYERMDDLAAAHFQQGVNGILIDLGISSMQVDNGQRGFSFRFDAPLDMRFDPAGDVPTAADLVNTLSAGELADLLYTYGEERHSRRIAREIIEARPITTTRQLADLLESGQRGPRQKIHPATRTFQALRIAVNDELGAVGRVLPIALETLEPGGRLAVITFHSLEDRIVKQYFKRESTDCLCPPKQPVCTCDHRAGITRVNRKPLMAGAEEVGANLRARSARLRIVEKRL